MPTKQEKAIKAAAVAAAEAVLEGDDTTQADDAALLTALVEIDGGDEVRWNVTRVSPAQQAGFCCTLGSSELKLEFLAEELGAGKYRIRGVHPDGTYAASRTITIAEETQAQKKRREARESQPQGGSVRDVLAEMEARRAASVDKWMPLLVAIAPALVSSIFGNRGPQIGELVTALSGIKQLTPDNSSQLDTFLKGLEAAKTFADKGSEGSTLMDVIRDVAGPLIGKMGAAQPSSPQTSTPAPSLVQQSHTAENPMLALMEWMRATLAALIGKARDNKDPALYAEVTLDNLPPGVALDKLQEYLAREDWWLVLQQFNPGVSPYQGWFERFRAEAIDMIEQQLEEDASAPQKASESAPP